MRAGGGVDSARGLVPFGHLGWGYTDRAEFHLRAREYLADGIARGQWIEYVGSGCAESLRAELTELVADNGERHAVAAGHVGVSTVEQFYEFLPGTDVVDPVRSVQARVAATEKALADGHTGFRAVVDATAVARTPQQRAAFARFEHLIDEKMSVLPVSAICAYDIGALGPDAAAALICLHPFTNHGSTLFRLYADPDVAFVLSGEVDISCSALLGAALDRALPDSSRAEVLIDGRGLEFIDHRGLLVLDRWAATRHNRAVLLSGQRRTARVAEMMDLQHVCVRGGAQG